MFVNIGYGKVRASQVTDFLAPEHKAPPELKENRIKAFMRRMRGRRSSGILLDGSDDVLVRYTKCCNPLPGDDIVGFMSRGRGITVHRRECERAFDADPERKVDIRWDTEAKIARPVALEVITANRPGILATVGQTFHTMEINISEATCRADDSGRATNTFRFLCSDVSTLNNVVRQLKKIAGVIDVTRE